VQEEGDIAKGRKSWSNMMDRDLNTVRKDIGSRVECMRHSERGPVGLI
jgi:hypothetical protein